LKPRNVGGKLMKIVLKRQPNNEKQTFTKKIKWQKFHLRIKL